MSAERERLVGQLDRRVGHVPRAAVFGGYKRSTVRFVDDTACCTCTYNYGMDDEKKTLLARRIAAALNLTRHLTVEQIESLLPNAQAQRLPTEVCGQSDAAPGYVSKP